jgi:hypothetical protein
VTARLGARADARAASAPAGRGKASGKYKRLKPIPYRVVDIGEDMTPRKLADRMGIRVRQVFGMLMDLGEKVRWRCTPPTPPSAPSAPSTP